MSNAGGAFCGAFAALSIGTGNCCRCRESWSLGVKEREGSVNGRRSDASRIQHGETGRLAVPWGIALGDCVRICARGRSQVSENMVKYHCSLASGEGMVKYV